MPLFTPEDDPVLRKDGQWLADYLGLSPEIIGKIKGSDGGDQLEARAINTALWHGTMGYMMETMMAPLFDAGDVSFTRAYFTNFVTGRGPLPALRIGLQPYGILPASVFNGLRWLSPRIGAVEGNLRAAATVGDFSRLTRLYGILRQMDTHWMSMSNDVSFVGKSGDAHQILLDILGLHATSVEYHQRYSESIDHLFNTMNMYGLGGTLLAAIIAAGYIQSGMDLLAEFGYSGEDEPDILKHLFLSSQNLLKGPLVDDRPLSESELIRAYTTDGRNYLHWLIDAARNSFEALRKPTDFIDNQSPAALLYIMLRYALMQSYRESTLQLFLLTEYLPVEQVQAMRHEPTFIHVADNVQVSESPMLPLYQTAPQITGSDNVLVADHITSLLNSNDPAQPQMVATAELREQVEALERLADLPTARLERLFAEHIDLCSYRLDAWEMGFYNYALLLLRNASGDVTDDGEDVIRRGLYLGAYGWIEDLRPEHKVLTPVELNDELNEVFNSDPDAPPLMRDSTNGGYIHAPSLNHAVTAAVLRNGYLENATPANPDTLKVNLSSERVRRAISAIEGIRSGQPLGALLGYQFERGLHDAHNLAEVDGFIYELRKAFPLRAKRLKSTLPADDTTSITALEARNVMDGLKLVEHIRQTGIDSYPFGLTTLPTATSAQQTAINLEVQRMLDTHDAVADVATAESVHQVVQGNFDRAASTLDTYTKGNFPPIPDVVQTPRSGITLTQRIGLHLRSGLNPNTSPVPGIAVTPRSHAEPALNDWLASVLPSPADVVCTVTVTDPISALETTVSVSQQDLALQPLDLIYILSQETQPAMAEIDDRVMRHIMTTLAPRADAEVRIEYVTMPADPGKLTFFELMPLVASLRRLALTSRPLLPTDVRLQNEARDTQDSTISLDVARVVNIRSGTNILRNDVANFQTPLDTLFADPVANRTAIIAAVQTTSDQWVELLQRASSFAIPQTGWGFIYARRAAIMHRTFNLIEDLISRWNQRLDQFLAEVATYDALPPGTPDEEQYSILVRAESWITTQPENPLPPTPAAMRILLTTKQSAFIAKRTQFEDLLDNMDTLPNLLADVAGIGLVDLFDPEPFALAPIEDDAILFMDECARWRRRWSPRWTRA